MNIIYALEKHFYAERTPTSSWRSNTAKTDDVKFNETASVYFSVTNRTPPPPPPLASQSWRYYQGVFIQWTGMDHWTTGMEHWTTGMQINSTTSRSTVTTCTYLDTFLSQ